MPDPIDTAVDQALGLVSEATPSEPRADRAIFDEGMRQQREILALQREAYKDLLATMQADQDRFISLLEKLGLKALRDHALPQFHGAGHVEHDGKDGFIL